MSMSTDVCAFCGAEVCEGDVAFQITAGYMVWHKYGYLAFEPVVNGRGEDVESLMHDLCFVDADGPEGHEPNIVDVSFVPEHVHSPHCTCCDAPLEAGDKVFMIVRGAVEECAYGNGLPDVGPESFGRVGNMDIMAAYCHKDCVNKGAAALLPRFPQPRVYVDEDYGDYRGPSDYGDNYIDESLMELAEEYYDGEY